MTDAWVDADSVRKSKQRLGAQFVTPRSDTWIDGTIALSGREFFYIVKAG